MTDHPIEDGTQRGPAYELAQVDAALARGDLQLARRLAELLVQSAPPDEAPAHAAGVLLRLAYCDLGQSRVRAALAAASKAARGFRDSAAATDEVDALALCAHAASFLGSAVQAVETAMLATQLTDDLPPGLWTARAYASLGLAHGWAKAFPQAEEALQVALQVIDRHGDASARLEIDVARWWVQAIRFLCEGRLTKYGPDRLSLDPSSGLDSGGLTTLTPGGSSTLATSATLVHGLLSLWSGRPDEAKSALARATEAGSTSVGWMLSAQSWLAAEIARQAGDLNAACLHATRMAALASEVEHLPLQCLGHELAAEIHLRQGDADLAFKEQSALLKCLSDMRARDLQGRADVAALRVESRRGIAQIKELSDKSMRFERWAHEDALTGIANLRRFNQCLTEWSAGGAQGASTLSVALIDVDLFRDINNNFSYEVGNGALRGIAEEMVANVRPADLAARWGGDEFAILFRDTDRRTAEQVASRIQHAVRQRDWSSVAEGLRVSVSVGVTEARAGDTKDSIIARSEDLMYAQKVARKRAEVEQAVEPLVLRTIVSWLGSARKVVVFVGHGTSTPDNPASCPGDVPALNAEDWRTFGDVRGLQSDPAGFSNFWHRWRRSMRGRQPSAAHKALVDLAHRLPEVLFVTERVDGVLAMAGAENVIEMYGNAFRVRCRQCGGVNPSRDGDRCVPCGALTATIRPDVVLQGEHVDPVLLSGVELAMKRADVILTVDCDVPVYPGSALIEKGRIRGARVIAFASGTHKRRDPSDVSITAPPEIVARVLAQALDEPPATRSAESELSPDGFAVLCFLTRQRADNLGVTLEQALAWKDWEVATHQWTIPWMFPLPTRSAMNPQAPMPSFRDFAQLATNEPVRQGMRDAFMLMLRFYGFEWRDGHVIKAEGWRNGFAQWAVTPSHHDLFISRVLRALRLIGLSDEATQFLRAIEVEVSLYRKHLAQEALWHWRLAVNGGPEDDQKAA